MTTGYVYEDRKVYDAATGGSLINIGAGGAGTQLDYVQRTSNYTTTSGSYSSVIDGNAITLDGSTRIKVEFYAPVFEVSSAGTVGVVELFDGSTDLCELSGVGHSSGQPMDLPCFLATFLTPSAGSHTFHIKGLRALGSGTFLIAGGSGTGANFAPCYYRITTA